jgi:hypothetical protein
VFKGSCIPWQRMNAKTSKLVGTVALVAIFALSGWWLSRKRGDAQSTTGSETITATNAPTAAVESTSSPTPKSNFESAANALAAAQSGDDRSTALARLREMLKSGNTNELSLAIRRLLDGKSDAATGQGFKIGDNGSLLEAPTLRTLLLDQLATLDPAAAAEYARTILNSSTSPDEWAIALRNLARGDTTAEARTFLEAKTGELLRNKAWQREASVGYLEAFDTAVHLGGTTLLPPLTELVSKKDNQAVAHAAFLTLDRLVINQPAQTLAVLNEHPEWMAGREETRANYFARADVGDTAQRQLVESYLLDAAREPAELQAFAGVFPNANFMISHNLLTSNATLDGATLARRDQASLEAVNQWLADPRFEKLHPQLEKMKTRLNEFTKKSDGK